MISREILRGVKREKKKARVHEYYVQEYIIHEHRKSEKEKEKEQEDMLIEKTRERENRFSNESLRERNHRKKQFLISRENWKGKGKDR